MVLNQETKKCPFCKEEINVDAVKCRFCNSILNGCLGEPQQDKQVDIQVGIVLDDSHKDQHTSKPVVKKIHFHFFETIIKLVFSLAVLAIIAFCIFNYTDLGEQIQTRYRQRVSETECFMESNLECVRLYIAYKNNPPMSLDEIQQFYVEHLQKKRIWTEKLGLPTFPSTTGRFYIEDAFGTKFLYSVDTVNRKITITSN